MKHRWGLAALSLCFLMQTGLDGSSFLSGKVSVESVSEWLEEIVNSEDSDRLRISSVTIEKDGNPILELICRKVRSVPRSYEAGVSASEEEDITYILRSLANHSLTKLKGEESSLKRAGDRIDDVHPLQFFLCAFLNEELKVCLRNLEGRSWVWKDFLKGVTESLAQEHANDNLMPYLDDFAAQLNIDPKVLMPSINGGKWDRFVTTLISVIPRAPGSDRYNM
jgi:hypothetical protein